MNIIMNDDAKSYNGHITPIKVYLLVGITLLILTGLTVKISTIHLGAWNAIAALAIASAKALLVALFFMHLLYDRRMYAVIVSTSIIMLGILVAFTMADVLRRGDIYENQGQPIHPEASFYSKLKPDSTTANPADTTGIKSQNAPSDSGAKVTGQ
jgi:cytochrome c oxidase subunit IV